MNFQSFLEKYYFEPVRKGLGYNPFTTFLLIISIAISLFIGYKILKKLKVKLDRKFFIDLIFPLSILGTLLRVFTDYKIFPRTIFTVSPLIWLEFLVFAFLMLIVYKKYENIKYLLYFLSIFSIILIIPRFKDFWTPTLILLAYIPSVYFYSILLLYFKKLRFETLLPGIGEILDGASAIVNIVFKGYFEEHFFTSLIIYDYPLAYLSLKILIPFFLILLIEESEMDEFDKNFLYFFIFILGFGPGLRNFLISFL